MRVEYFNIYPDDERSLFGHPSAWSARMNSDVDVPVVAVEMHINGHWHRPPVGMRSEQASHEWVLGLGPWASLEPKPCQS
jgi:hypothetical protein